MFVSVSFPWALFLSMVHDTFPKILLQRGALRGDCTEMPRTLALLFLVNCQSQSWLALLAVATISVSLLLPLTVSLSAPSERVPHSHTVNAVSHTYPVTPPGHCAIKSQAVFIQTHGITSSASRHPYLTLQSTSCQGPAVCATVRLL